uniref:Uncharacterized protein n=1 Tax=Ophiostoma piceae TaxID=61273 RepID=A4UGZ1_9PEZI|nr:hypothetical protein [Ophiostoma piceae]
MNTPETATPPAFPSPPAKNHKRGEEFRDYPFLTHDEFTEVCHDFDRIYRQATLGPLRRKWRVSVNVAFNTSFAAGDRDFTTFLQISRPLENTAKQHDDELSGVLDKFSFGDDGAGLSSQDEEMMAAEDADEAALTPTPLRMYDYGYVTYEIHLHPTYRAPCLWFSMHNLPNDEPAFSIDTVFRHLVPPQFQDTLRSMGSIGGISADVS